MSGRILVDSDRCHVFKRLHFVRGWYIFQCCWIIIKLNVSIMFSRNGILYTGGIFFRPLRHLQPWLLLHCRINIMRSVWCRNVLGIRSLVLHKLCCRYILDCDISKRVRKLPCWILLSSYWRPRMYSLWRRNLLVDYASIFN